MKGYGEQTLRELEHIKPKQTYLGPLRMTTPEYGQ